MQLGKPTKLISQETHIKSLLGRTAVITIQREAAEDEIVDIDDEEKPIGFNNNIYNNCHVDYALTSASPVLDRLLPKDENERVQLAKKLR
jgi:hypothetical protein